MNFLIAHAAALLAALGQSPGPPTPTSTSAVFEGVVRGPDRRPLARATVRGWALVTESREPITASVETDAAGRFLLELESAARYAIVVQAPGLAPEALIDVKPGRLVVALSKGDVLEGTVRDASTSAPLAGAEVRIVEAQGFNQRQTISDAKGRFRFDGVGRGDHAVRADAAGCVRADRQPVGTCRRARGSA